MRKFEYMFSIIMPVYNEGENLHNTINCFIDLKPCVYELILVNDGSKDDSGLICDGYAKKYPYIKTIHKENGGGVEARKYGIRQSLGQYVVFSDADDFVEDNYIQCLCDAVMHTADYYILNNQIKINGIRKYREKNFLMNGYIDKDEACEWIVGGKAGAVWDKIFVGDLIRKVNLDHKLMFGDDVYMNLNYMYLVNTVFVHDTAAYIHVLDSDTSICRYSADLGRLDEIDLLYNLGIKMLKDMKCPQNIINKFVDIEIGNTVKCIAQLKSQKYSNKKIRNSLVKMKLKRDCNNFIGTGVTGKIYTFLLKKEFFLGISLVCGLRQKLK